MDSTGSHDFKPLCINSPLYFDFGVEVLFQIARHLIGDEDCF